MTADRIIALAIVSTGIGGFLLWWLVDWLRDLRAFARSNEIAQVQLPWLIADAQAEQEQREELMALGFDHHDLDVHHMVIADRETGLPTVVYTVPSAMLEARVDLMLSRFVEAYRPAASSI